VAAPLRARLRRLSGGQRWSYLAGALQWYGDLLGLLFLIFLLAGAANLATGGGQLFRKLTVFLVAAVPVMVLLLFPTLGMAAAPVNSWAARRAALPASLSERRRTEYRRDRRSFAAGVATGGAVAVLGVAIAAVVEPGSEPVDVPGRDGVAQRVGVSLEPVGAT
jgi:hypothetical protein